MLDNPYNIASMTKGKAPGKARKITKQQLKKFNKKMRALKVAKLEGSSKELLNNDMLVKAYMGLGKVNND